LISYHRSFALLFLFALAKTWWHILRSEMPLHREWMIQAFAIVLAVATLRPIVGAFFATDRLTAHLAAAEIYITRSRRTAIPGKTGFAVVRRTARIFDPPRNIITRRTSRHCPPNRRWPC
jgi:hypothetical protein